MARQVAHRAVDQRVERLQHRRPDQRHRLARRARAVRIDRVACLGPQVGRGELACIDQRRREQRTGFVGPRAARAQAARAALAHVLAGLLLDQQCVAADLAVVVHPEARVVDDEGRPVAALAQFEQPVVAQAVFDVAARPAGVETHRPRPAAARAAAGSGPSSRATSPADAAWRRRSPWPGPGAPGPSCGRPRGRRGCSRCWRAARPAPRPGPAPAPASPCRACRQPAHLQERHAMPRGRAPGRVWRTLSVWRSWISKMSIDTPSPAAADRTALRARLREAREAFVAGPGAEAAAAALSGPPGDGAGTARAPVPGSVLADTQ